MCWNVLNDENGSTDPYRILALRWGDDLNLHRGGCEGFKLLGHALTNCRKLERVCAGTVCTEATRLAVVVSELSLHNPAHGRRPGAYVAKCYYYYYH